MDKIIIENLQFYGYVGVTPAEREVGQRLVVSLEAVYDLSRAGASDQLDDTISYAALAETVQEVGLATRCHLLEFMAAEMVRAVLERFPVQEVRLRLLKRPPPTDTIIEAAGVELYRRR